MKDTVYYSPERVEVLRQQTYLSPHTVLLINNPVHAYLCTGEDCRKAVNTAERTE